MFFARLSLLIQLIKLSDKLDTLLLKACQLAKAKDVKSSDVNNFIDNLSSNCAKIERY